MKFFIDNPKTYLSVNNKGRVMNKWISTFAHVLIPDELSRDAFIESVRAKASMLDEEFPRTKPLRVDVSRNNDIRIEVYPDKIRIILSSSLIFIQYAVSSASVNLQTLKYWKEV